MLIESNFNWYKLVAQMCCKYPDCQEENIIKQLIEGSMLYLHYFTMPFTVTQLLKSQIIMCRCNYPPEIFIIYDLFHIWLQLLLIKIVISQAQLSYGITYLIHYFTAPLTITLVYLSTCLSEFYFEIVLMCGLWLFATWALSVHLSAQYNNYM